jgi:hypothetical protein
MALTDNANDIVDINIDGIKRQRFRINGNNDSVIELNLSDLNTIDRMKEGLEKLDAEMTEIANLPDDDNLKDKLNEADKRMREYVDYIFDYPVSDACIKNGSMYDPKNGMFAYEHIIDALTKLYTNNLNEEYKKMKSRIQKHTDKYTGKPTKSTKKKG